MKKKGEVWGWGGLTLLRGPRGKALKKNKKLNPMSKKGGGLRRLYPSHESKRGGVQHWEARGKGRGGNKGFKRQPYPAIGRSEKKKTQWGKKRPDFKRLKTSLRRRRDEAWI